MRRAMMQLGRNEYGRKCREIKKRAQAGVVEEHGRKKDRERCKEECKIRDWYLELLESEDPKVPGEFGNMRL